MRILGIAGQPPRRVAQPAASPPRRGGAAGGRRARHLRRPRRDPAVRPGSRRPPAARGRALEGRHRRRRRDPRRDAGVQRLDPRPAEERLRLGLPAARRESDPLEARRRDRREHERVRRRLGPARAQEGAGDHGRERARRRAAGREGRPVASRSRTSSSAPSSASSSVRSSSQRRRRRSAASTEVDPRALAHVETRAVRVTMLLADFAQVADGKLTVVGGGWSLTGPEPCRSASRS